MSNKIKELKQQIKEEKMRVRAERKLNKAGLFERFVGSMVNSARNATNQLGELQNSLELARKDPYNYKANEAVTEVERIVSKLQKRKVNGKVVSPRDHELLSKLYISMAAIQEDEKVHEVVREAAGCMTVAISALMPGGEQLLEFENKLNQASSFEDFMNLAKTIQQTT